MRDYILMREMRISSVPIGHFPAPGFLTTFVDLVEAVNPNCAIRTNDYLVT